MSSPYRESGGVAPKRRKQGETGPLAVVDATGAPGANAMSGTSGGTGGDGTHAGPASPGAPGGTIDVTLSEPAAGEIAVTGSVQGRRHVEAVDVRTAIGDAGSLRLVAYGGSGGQGGVGGDGGGGARGHDGSDATRYSSGSDGGRGGDGGDGGDGSSGAPGGRGGNVVLRAAKTDTHLFMLADLAVGGGRGGAAGQNGRGGHGGAGGRGGSSYSWTETESYTDSQGNSQTRTTHHSNRGGSDGPSGRSGRDGVAILSKGADGAPGTVTFVVGDGTNLVQYPWRYELRLTGLVHVDQNGDGIYEPEETVHVTQITVKNVGGMPTPETRDVLIALVDDGWVAPEEGKTLKLPAGLAPGASHTFDEALTFRLRLFRPQEPGEALSVTERVHLVAWIPDARRRFADFEREIGKQPLVVVRFPATLSPIDAPLALAPGERARIAWSVENVSGHALGDAEGRSLATRAEAQGDAGASLDVTEPQPIRSLSAGTKVGSYAFLSVPEAAPDYTTTTIALELSLGSPDTPEVARPIQLREVAIRTVTPYVAQKVDVLFVVASGTNRAEVEAWRGMASALGLSSSVYDLTMQHLLDDERLATDVEGGALVFVDVPKTGTDGRPHHTLTPRALARFSSRGVRVAIVGEAPALTNLLFETEPEAVSDALALPDDERSRTLTKWLPVLFEPKPSHLESRARAVQSWLDRSRPHQRYSIQWRFDATKDKTLGVANRYQIGTIRAVRGPDHGALVHVGVPSATLHDPTALTTTAGLTALASALPSPLLVRRFLAASPAEAKAMGAVVLDRIVRELSVSRRARHAGREALPTLLAVVEYANLGADERLAELLRDLHVVASSLVRLWEWVPPLPWLRTGPRLRRLVRELVLEARTRAGLAEDALAIPKGHRLAKSSFDAIAEELSAALPFPVLDEHETFGEAGDASGRLKDDHEVKELARLWAKRERRLRKEAEEAEGARRRLLAPGH